MARNQEISFDASLKHQNQWESATQMRQSLIFQVANRGSYINTVFSSLFIVGKGIHPSMSRKGNNPYNDMMESFFCLLKSEMFYGYEKTFKSLEQLEQAIVDYFDYYNNKRIGAKLKGLNPVQYRTKSFG